MEQGGLWKPPCVWIHNMKTMWQLYLIKKKFVCFFFLQMHFEFYKTFAARDLTASNGKFHPLFWGSIAGAPCRDTIGLDGCLHTKGNLGGVGGGVDWILNFLGSQNQRVWVQHQPSGNMWRQFFLMLSSRKACSFPIWAGSAWISLQLTSYKGSQSAGNE